VARHLTVNWILSSSPCSCRPARQERRPGISRAAFRKASGSLKLAHWPVNTPVPSKSRTTTFGPFGEVIRQTGPIAKANPMRFSTKYQDDESDLVYYGHRYYKASTGTWLSADPIDEMGFQITNARRGDRPQGESNLYLYVKNNSILYIDVNGLNWADVQKMYDAFLATFDALCKSCKRCDSPHFGNLCSLFGASTLGCSKQADALGANILAVKKRRSLGYTKSLLVLFGWAFNS